MSGKRKLNEHKPAPSFPALREFFSGYLHQDFRDEYGSAAAAALAFRKDASEAEVEAVRQEWRAWRRALSKSSPSGIAVAARQLGAAWQPQTARDLDDVESALNAR